ncbi:AAA family ATPase [Parvibacter caecicola]|uniref:AAA family ATPase n=1 Tax=Parvibacter caecicola TaxID=747645 RepID=UPI00249CC586|nr:AAA family ATPase [Parvibacter caecicola]
MEPVKITALEAENVKRVRAVELRPEKDGLTVIGGRNGQGKTSVLDAIAWALGGDRFKPSQPHREGSVNDPRLKVELSNGLVVERSGKNSALKVTDPSGKRAGQQLLNSFVEQLAIDLPRFMESSPKEKAKTMLEVIGVGEELYRLEAAERKAYDERTAVGTMERQKRALAEEMPFDPDAPAEPVSAAEAAREKAEIIERNAALAQERAKADGIGARMDAVENDMAEVDSQMARLAEQKERMRLELEAMARERSRMMEGLSGRAMEDTAEVDALLEEIDAINARVRDNQLRLAAIREADGLKERYDALTEQVEAARNEKLRLLEGAALPLPELSVDAGELTYKGRRWDGMSGSEQLMVSAAIVRALKPQCGFVLVDKLEQFDPQTLAEFGRWAESEGLQIIGTRVASDDTCTIVIEDGVSKGTLAPMPAADIEPTADALEAYFGPEARAARWVI